MTYRKVYSVENNKVIINLPDDFKGKKQVLIVVDDLADTKEQKLELMKQASKDPLFLADIKEIQDDFDSIDHENL
jgi:hypothetical protein